MKLSLLSLAGATLVVATATACSSTTPAADEPRETASASVRPSSSTAPTDAADSAAPSEASDPTSSDASAGAGAGDGEQADGPCRTDDLSIEVTEQSQAGGYYLITATAKPGVTCTLKGETAPVAFGSAEEAHAGPAEQAAGPAVTVSGDKKAYAGVSPKSGNGDGGVLYPQIIVSATNDDPDPVSIDLPKEAEVAAPVATNWVANPKNAVPF